MQLPSDGWLPAWQPHANRNTRPVSVKAPSVLQLAVPCRICVTTCAMAMFALGAHLFQPKLTFLFTESFKSFSRSLVTTKLQVQYPVCLCRGRWIIKEERVAATR